jgi:hypothetical protein
VASFLRPHTINVYRTVTADVAGRGGYGADLQDEEVLVYGPIEANIQEARQARPVPTSIPTGTMFRGLYLIVFEGPNGTVHTKDIVVDENKNRYQLITVQWGRFGYSVIGELMEV